MNKFLYGLVGAFALCAASVSGQAAPASQAPVAAAVFHPETAPAQVQTVQYYAPPRPHYRRPPPRYRNGYYRGRGHYRGPHYARGPGRRY